MAVMFGVTWVSQAPGQTLPDWLAKEGILVPPASGIRDESNFFSRDSGSFQRISNRLRSLEAQRGYRIYLMVEPVLIGTNASELAAKLKQSWLPEGNGLVIVYEVDNKNLGIGRDLSVSDDPHAPKILIPMHETAALISRAFETADPKLAPEPYIEAFTSQIVDECNRYFQLREAPAPTDRSIRVILLAVGGITLLALAMIGLGWMLKHSPMAEVRSFRFPVVDPPERLGAPCGASVIARRFGKSKP